MSSAARRPVPPNGAAQRSTDQSPRGPSKTTSVSNSSAGTDSKSGNTTRAPPSRQSPVPVSARAAARKPGTTRSSMSVSEDDLRAETAQLVEDLKAQLQRAEAASDQYRKQLDLLQSRLDETTHEHLALEEKLHEQDGKIESLKLEVKAHIKEKRDIEQSIEAERAMMAKDKEQHNAKEEALQAIIQRLNEGLKQREVPRAISRSCKIWSPLMVVSH